MSPDALVPLLLRATLCTAAALSICLLRRRPLRSWQCNGGVRDLGMRSSGFAGRRAAKPAIGCCDVEGAAACCDAGSVQCA